MTTQSYISDAQQLDAVIQDLERINTNVIRRKVRAYDVKLYPDDTVFLGDGPRFPISFAALGDLGRMVNIPQEYFLTTCDSKLRCASFNYLLRNAGTEHAAFIAEIAVEKLTSISPTCLMPVPRLDILRSVRASIPKSIDPANVKVVKHRWDGTFDISVIAETLTCEPRVNDVVAFGVSVADDVKGSVQVQGAAFRLICRNGAVIRICDNNERRLRRPMFHTNRDDDYFRRVKVLASEAWQKWDANAADIQHLPDVPIYEERFDELRSTLRNAPFFLSAGLADQVLARIRIEAETFHAAPTAFDLWNSLTFIGSHTGGVSPLMSYRLRRGAGELSHHVSRTCSACKQLVLS